MGRRHRRTTEPPNVQPLVPALEQAEAAAAPTLQIGRPIPLKVVVITGVVPTITEYTAYRVECLGLEPEQMWAVTKRFSDFDQLREELSNLHCDVADYGFPTKFT